MEYEIENKAYDVASQIAVWIETVELQTQIENTLNVIEHFKIIFENIDPETLDEFSGLLTICGSVGSDWRSAITYFHDFYVNSGRCIPSLIYQIVQFIDKGGAVMGRPTLSDDIKKDSIHSVCLDVEDSDFLKSYAEKYQISISEALRMAVIYLKSKASR